MRKRTVITEEIEGVDCVDCELTFEPCYSDEIIKAKVGDKLLIGYLVYDDDYRDIDDMLGDCMGKMYSFHRFSKDIAEGMAALGNTRDGDANLDAVWDKHWKVALDRYIACVLYDHGAEDVVENFETSSSDYERRDGETLEATAKRYLEADVSSAYNGYGYGYAYVMYDEIMTDVVEKMWSEPAYFPGDLDAQLLACYSHSGEHWSLSGSGTQCRWDTSNSAGVWVPDAYLREQLNTDEAAGKDRCTQARMYCKQFLDQFNDINSGQVFGVVVEWFEEDGTELDHDSCWGYIGSDHAAESLKENFECHRASLQKAYDAEVHTQGGKQVEML